MLIQPFFERIDPGIGSTCGHTAPQLFELSLTFGEHAVEYRRIKFHDAAD